MAEHCELANRVTVRVFQAEGHILIAVAGDLPDPGYDIDIEQHPRRIFPPQYNIVRYRRPGVFPAIITPFRICRSFPLGDRVPEITIHHGEGTDKVSIEPCKDDLTWYEESCRFDDDIDGSVPAMGRSNNLSIDEALADALNQLPPSPVADGLTKIKIKEIGGLFGGVTGFHELFVKIHANIEGIS